MDGREFPKCDICGKLATNFAQDVYVCDGLDARKHSKPVGVIKCGCDEHIPMSHDIDVSVNDPRFLPEWAR